MNLIILTDIYTKQEVTVNPSAIVMMRRYDAEYGVSARTYVALTGESCTVHETPEKIRQLIQNACGVVQVELPYGGVPGMHHPRRDDIGKYTDK